MSWRASDEHHIEASYQLDNTELRVNVVLDDDARVRSITLARWGDPESTGKWDHYPFGFEATGYTAFGGVTIPTTGCAGWFFATERWPESESFRYEMTEYQLVTEGAR